MYRVYVRVLNKYSSRIRLRSYSDLVRSSLFPVLTLFPSFSVIFDDLSCELRYSKLEENLKFLQVNTSKYRIIDFCHLKLYFLLIWVKDAFLAFHPFIYASLFSISLTNIETDIHLKNISFKMLSIYCFLLFMPIITSNVSFLDSLVKTTDRNRSDRTKTNNRLPGLIRPSVDPWSRLYIG